jgi:hypothetical protein
MASYAARTTDSGPLTSGKPCPRLTDPVRTARADMVVKMVGGMPWRRDAITMPI